MDNAQLERILEAALLAAGRPLNMNQLEALFHHESAPPSRAAIREALSALDEHWRERSLVLQEVASGFRVQVREEFEPWVARLWEEKPPRYSRALLETLAIIAYRQPVTRPEIEEIRGVSVSTQIMKTLQEREWIRVVGHREAPGRPAMYGTTRQFLDHFNLKTLDQLPPLSELRELDARYPELAFEGESGGDEGGTADQGSGDPSAEAGEDGAGTAGPPGIDPDADTIRMHATGLATAPDERREYESPGGDSGGSAPPPDAGTSGDDGQDSAESPDHEGDGTDEDQR